MHPCCKVALSTLNPIDVPIASHRTLQLNALMAGYGKLAVQVALIVVLCEGFVAGRRVVDGSKGALTGTLRKQLRGMTAGMASLKDSSRGHRGRAERGDRGERRDDDHEEEDETTIREMEQEVASLKRALEEERAEKKKLSGVVRDEQEQLTKLQARIQNPSLGEWLQRRAELAKSMLPVEAETDAVAYYARLYMKPKLGRVRHGLANLEKRVEQGVDHVLPARYGAMVALLLTAALVGFPMVVAMRVTVSLTRTLSLAQYVLLSNVFLSALAFGLCAARAILQQDPLQTLYEASEPLFMVTQLVLGAAFPAFLLLLCATCWHARRRGNAYIFGCELVFYTMIGVNYRRRVWHPVMVGEVIHANATMYIVYLIDFVCMTVLTVAAARDSAGTFEGLPTQTNCGTKNS